MSVKKDRFDNRKFRNAHGGSAGPWWDKAPTKARRALVRLQRTRDRQLIRETRYHLLARWRRTAGWDYW